VGMWEGLMTLEALTIRGVSGAVFSRFVHLYLIVRFSYYLHM
jgi:hypothetical protein